MLKIKVFIVLLMCILLSSVTVNNAMAVTLNFYETNNDGKVPQTGLVYENKFKSITPGKFSDYKFYVQAIAQESGHSKDIKPKNPKAEQKILSSGAVEGGEAGYYYASKEIDSGLAKSGITEARITGYSQLLDKNTNSYGKKVKNTDVIGIGMYIANPHLKVNPNAKSSKAEIKLKDPFEFEGSPNDAGVFSIFGVIPQGLAMNTSDIDPNTQIGKTEYRSSAWTTLSGYEALYTLNISNSSDSLDGIVAKFWSNPNMGLDDEYIEDLIENAFEFDSDTGDWVLTSDLNYFNYDFEFTSANNPEFNDIESYTIGLDIELEASSTNIPVPEPSSLYFGVITLASIAMKKLKR